MQNKILNILKAATIKVVVAFLFSLIVFLAYKGLLEKKFETVASLVNMLTPIKETKLEPVLKDLELVNKPSLNSKYATLKIPKIDVDLPIYYGDNLSVLKYGIGQDPESYFPGENGTIIYMGHNYKSFLAKLPELKKGDTIEVKTEYGTFDYEVYETKIVGEYDTDEAPIQKGQETLIIYTCWPINNIGHASERYLVYAK